MKILLVLLLLLLLLASRPASSKRIRKNNDPQAREFLIRNWSTSHVGIYWMNLVTGESKHQFDLVAGAKNFLNSHVIHEFEIREKPDKKGKCDGKKGKCRKTYFQVTEDEDQVFTIEPNFKVVATNSRKRAKEKATNALKKCRDLDKYGTPPEVSPLEQLDQLAECMKENVHESIYESQEEIYFQASVRRDLGSRLKIYACNDPKFPATYPLFTKQWEPHNSRLATLDDDEGHAAKILLQTDTTIIALIENIAKPSDCESMQKLAKANENDTSLVPWEARTDPATLDFLSRIYAYANPAIKLMEVYAGLTERGKDLFKFYHDSSATPNQQELHQEEIFSTWPVEAPMFARLLMFCEVPEEDAGGAIHFPESGVHIQPRLGEGLLITYTKPPTTGQGYKEKFTNEHYDCPILEGNRTIIQHQFPIFPLNKG